MRRQWWHGLTAYQIYPRSFRDSNGDGYGDLQGITEKLPYLKELGIDLVWLSPIYKSPGIDNGYDIADYQAIDPLFGTMEDFDALMEKARELNLKIIMDLVVNHCSSEHEWFKKACADPGCEEASYFYFREGRNGHEPNNLRANFGGSIWDKVPGQDNLYYCHFFAKEQPDLDWFNPKLREKIYAMMNWWLDKGIAGFRVDAIMCIGKDPTFPDFEPDPLGDGRCGCGAMNERCNDVADRFLREMHERVLKPRNAFTVGEVFCLNKNNIERFIGEDGNFSAIFDFAAREALTAHCAYFAYEKLPVSKYREVTFRSQELTNDVGFLCPVIENHDEPRGVSTYLPPLWHNARGAKALGTVNLLLRGVPFIYEGQEIGMTNSRFDTIYEFKDLQSHDEYQKCLAHGLSEYEALRILNDEARDQCRTPMLWDDTLNAGFSTGIPWMRVHQDYPHLNVKAQMADPDSVWHHYKALIALRKNPEFKDTITYGRFKALPDPNGHTLAFLREGERNTLMVIANFGEGSVTFDTYDTARPLLTSGEVHLNAHSVTVAGGSSAVLLL